MASGSFFSVALAVAAFALFVVPFLFGRVGVPNADAFPADKPDYRIENVRDVAHETRDSACIGIIGNSRVAFQVETASIQSGGCRSVNLGFPGLTPYQHVQIAQGRIADEISRVDTLVMTLSMDQFLLERSQRPEPDLESLLAAGRRVRVGIRDYLLDWSATNRIGRGQLKIGLLIDRWRGRAPVSSGWSYSSSLGRWVYQSIDTRSFDALASKSQELKEMAFRYYALRYLPDNYAKIISDIVSRATRNFARVVILLPPEHPEFGSHRDYYVAGLEDQFFSKLKGIAEAMNVHLIDCRAASDCGVRNHMFADPVHLNSAGAAAYSQHLARMLLKVRS